MCFFFCVKQKTAYDMRISDWSSDVCSSDLNLDRRRHVLQHLDHPVGGLQERCATAGRAIAGGRIDQLFGGKTIGQWYALRLVRRVVQLRQRSLDRKSGG